MRPCGVAGIEVREPEALALRHPVRLEEFLQALPIRLVHRVALRRRACAYVAEPGRTGGPGLALPGQCTCATALASGPGSSATGMPSSRRNSTTPSRQALSRSPSDAVLGVAAPGVQCRDAVGTVAAMALGHVERHVDEADRAVPIEPELSGGRGIGR